jgi:hypothetical protein
MDRQGEDGWVARTHGRSAITLVHIQVKDQHPLHCSLLQQHCCCVGQVIEDTKA